MPRILKTNTLFSALFIFCLSWHTLQAQFGLKPDISPGPTSTVLPIDDQNWEITRNPVNGFIYFANTAGLVEYNGISARLLTMPYSQSVRSVYADKSGVLYTGSFEDFGKWITDPDGKYVYHSLASDINMPKNDEIWNIFEYKGVLYFQSFTTIYSFQNNIVKGIQCPGIMLFMFKRPDGFFVQVLGQGLFHFNGKQFNPIRGSEIFANAEILSIINKPQGEYWICTSRNGIYNYDGTTFKPLNNEVSDFLKSYNCNAGLAINDSLFVFGSILNGIVFCNSKGEITKSLNYSNGLNNNTILSLYVDGNHGLWIGLDEGANYLNLNSPFVLYADKSGTLGTIYSVIRKNDLLYLGTNHGLFAAGLSKTSGGYSFSDFRLIPGTQGQVWKLFEFGDQILCGHNDGTFLIEGRDIRKISGITGGWAFAGYNHLLLQGNYTGLATFSQGHDGRWRLNGRISGFTEPTRYIETDYLGYVWAIHSVKGIYRLELNEKADSIVSMLHFEGIGKQSGPIGISMVNNQVVFSTGENLYSFDAENRIFYPLKSLEKGLGEYIRANHIIHYEKNSYWFMLENKLALFDVSKSLEAFKINEIFRKNPDLPGRQLQIISLDRNTLLIPNRQAFSLLNLPSTRNSVSGSTPVIFRLVFSGKNKEKTIIPGESAFPAIPDYEKNLTVFLGDTSGFDHAEKEYFYRIVELDDQWRLTKNDNFTFLNLKFGDYHLQVKTLLGDYMAETTFTIKRPWYLSTLAVLGYLLLLVALALSGYKIFRIELNRHRRLIEYELKRNRLENELDYKNYELMLTMRYLIRKTEILRELQDQIDSIREESSKFPVKFIREMERIIREGLDSQTEEWKSAMNHLKLSQEGFFRKLKEKYPDLTPNDLRLCSYLRMNFTTKEMAHLLNISGRAVEIGRYRLRRKMNLDRNVNLTEFLIREAE